MKVAIAALLATLLPSAHVAMAQISLPAVSGLNGKLSTEGGAIGSGGDASGIGLFNGSISAPLGHPFGLQIDGQTGTAFDSNFFSGAGHLFWRDPAIGLFGPVASLMGGSGYLLGWYGAEAELYVGRLTIGARGGYHSAADNVVGVSAASGYYGGSLRLYPTPDVAVSAGVSVELQRASGNAALEYQPDLSGRRNVSFFINGALAERSTYSVTAGFRVYFGPEKPLIRRHREDDPVSALEAEHQLIFFPPIGGDVGSLQRLRSRFAADTQEAKRLLQ